MQYLNTNTCTSKNAYFKLSLNIGEERLEIYPGYNSHWRHKNHFILCNFSQCMYFLNNIIKK